MKYIHGVFIIVILLCSSLSYGQSSTRIELNVNSCITAVHSSNINLDFEGIYIFGLEWDHFPITPHVELGIDQKINNLNFKLGVGVRQISLPFKLIPYVSQYEYKSEIRYKLDVYNLSLKFLIAKPNERLSFYSGMNVFFGYYKDFNSSYREGEYYLESQTDPIKYKLGLSYGKSANLLWSNQLNYSLIKKPKFELGINSEFSYGILHMLTAVGLYQINEGVSASNMSMTRGTNLLLGLSFKFL